MLQCGMGFARSARAQDAGGEPFDFDRLTAAMPALAAESARDPERAEGLFSTLYYDDYQAIQFDPDRARWAGDGAGFHLHAFHLGWHFAEPAHARRAQPDAACGDGKRQLHRGPTASPSRRARKR